MKTKTGNRRGFVIESNINGCSCNRYVILRDTDFGDYFHDTTDGIPTGTPSVISDWQIDGQCPKCNAWVTYDRHFVVTHTEQDRQLQLPLPIDWTAEVERISNLRGD